ncbi:MAG: hypothetical protein Q6361_03910 [Candidatus Hermodarchaeota archaeon]|nr:hypothetical protein [Candidatus Hermodarchaeota archaeon]
MNPKTLPPTAGQKTSESKPGSRLREADEPKLKKKRKKVPVVICRLEGQKLVPMVKENGEWLTFESTSEAWKHIRSYDKVQEGIEYLILTIQRRFKLKFQQVKKVTMES